MKTKKYSRTKYHDTVDELMLAWSAMDTDNTACASVSTQGTKLFSYDLQIADIFGTTALILAPSSPSNTTSKHISWAASRAHDSGVLTHAFMVPDLDPLSIDNANYLCNAVNFYRKSMLSRSKQYRYRVDAILYYYGSLTELYEYSAFAHAYDTVKMPPPYIEHKTATQQIMKSGGHAFLGELALEGDAHRIHELEAKYVELHHNF